MTTMAFGLGKPSPGQKSYDHTSNITLVHTRNDIDKVRVINAIFSEIMFILMAI